MRTVISMDQELRERLTNALSEVTVDPLPEMIEIDREYETGVGFKTPIALSTRQILALAERLGVNQEDIDQLKWQLEYTAQLNSANQEAKCYLCGIPHGIAGTLGIVEQGAICLDCLDHYNE